MTQRGKNIIAAVTCTVAAAAIAVIGFLAWAPDIVHTPAGETRAHLRIYSQYVEQYRGGKGRYPTTEDGLEQLARDGFVREGMFRDGWRNPLQYRYPSKQKGQPFDLWSLGADGKPGGENENADIEWKK